MFVLAADCFGPYPESIMNKFSEELLQLLPFAIGRGRIEFSLEASVYHCFSYATQEQEEMVTQIYRP